MIRCPKCTKELSHAPTFSNEEKDQYECLNQDCTVTTVIINYRWNDKA